MSDDENDNERNNPANIDELLKSLRRGAGIESTSDETDGGAEELLAFLRGSSKESGEPEAKTVTIKRERATYCSFCNSLLAKTDRFVKGKTGVTICTNCLNECSRLIKADNPGTA